MKPIQLLSGLVLLAGLAIAGYWFLAPFYTQAVYGQQGFVWTTPETGGGVMHHITSLSGNADLQASRLTSVIFGLGLSFLGAFGLAASSRVGVGAVADSSTRPV